MGYLNAPNFRNPRITTKTTFYETDHQILTF